MNYNPKLWEAWKSPHLRTCNHQMFGTFAHCSCEPSQLDCGPSERSLRRWVKQTDQNQRKGKGKRGFWLGYKDDSWMKSVGLNLNSCSLFSIPLRTCLVTWACLAYDAHLHFCLFSNRPWQFSRFKQRDFQQAQYSDSNFTLQTQRCFFTVWTCARSPAEPHGHDNNKAIQG